MFIVNRTSVNYVSRCESVNMNMNQNDKVFQNSEHNFHREKEHAWGPHVSDTIFFTHNLFLLPFLAIARSWPDIPDSEYQHVYS